MRSTRIKAAIGLAGCLTLAGCADYLSNRDTVTLGVGNAMEANVGIHTINPFPPEAWDTDIDGDGRAVARAQRIYSRESGAPPVVPPATTTTGASATAN